MSDGRCATCKHWQTENGPIHEDGRRIYLAAERKTVIDPRFVDWKSCALISGGPCWDSGFKAGVMISEYCEGNTEVFTAPDFGCVQWEAKA